MRTSHFRQVLLGLLIGIAATGGTPARAQWTVYDPAEYALQTEWRVEEAGRWVERVRQHIEQYQMLINQWITLKDVLTSAEELVSHNVKWASTMASIGKSVRGIFQIKDQIESLVRLKIQALKSIATRLKGGIFNPEADLADLEEYLTFGIGRASWARVATLERLADFDNTLETLYERWQIACAKRASLEKELTNAREQHDAAVAKGESPDSIAAMELQIKQIEQALLDVNKQIDELWTELVERARKYQARIILREDAAAEILTTEQAWDDFLVSKEGAMAEVERFDGAARDARQGWRPPPADPGPIFPGGQR